MKLWQILIIEEYFRPVNDNTYIISDKIKFLTTLEENEINDDEENISHDMVWWYDMKPLCYNRLVSTD